MQSLPPTFYKMLAEQLKAAQLTEFQEALQEPVPVSIRLHPKKQATLPHDVEAAVKWHAHGRYLTTRPVFTLDPLLHAGAYYVQEASSMLLHQAIAQHIDCSKDMRVLDLCAAPGGKSTLLASLLTENSLLVCNEIVKTRIHILEHNLERWGHSNIAITSCDAEELARLHHFFDVMVVDAPCSGEGLFRKDPNAVKEWSPESVQMCAARQRNILTAAMDALRPGGLLVYSTCTYNKYENEANCQWMTESLGLEYLPIAVKENWGFKAIDMGLHAFPQHVRGEGFFIAAFRKPEENTTSSKRKIGAAKYKRMTATTAVQKAILKPWFKNPQATSLVFTPSEMLRAYPISLEEDMIYLENHLKNIRIGTEAGNIKGKDFVPAHALSQSFLVHEDLPNVEVDLQTALLLLKREQFALPPEHLHPKGWARITYQNLPLAWVKLLPNRINNYLPQERRILMDIVGR